MPWYKKLDCCYALYHHSWNVSCPIKYLFGTHCYIIKLKAQPLKLQDFMTWVLIWKLTKKYIFWCINIKELMSCPFPTHYLKYLNTWTMHRDKMGYTSHLPALFNHVLTMFYHLSCNMNNFVKPRTKYFQNVRRKFQHNPNVNIWFCIIWCWTLTWQDGTVAGMHAG